MVNFGPLSAEILSLVWGTPANSTGFASWKHYCTAFSSGRQPNFAALNRERHLCSAGRPSRWALPHILVRIIMQHETDTETYIILEMWVNAQRDGRPAEYRWRPLFNAAVWLTPTTKVPCSNSAKTRNPLKLPVVPQTNERISAARGPKYTIMWGHVGDILLLNKFFSDCRYMP